MTISTPGLVRAGSTPAERVRATALKAVLGGLIASRWAAGDPIARLVAPAGRADPYPVYRRARERGPLVPSMIGLVTAHHDVATEILRDHERFGSAPVPRPTHGPTSVIARVIGALSPDGLPETVDRRRAYPDVFDRTPDPLGAESMIGMDPPDHTRVRRLVSRAFTPRAVARIQDRVEEVAQRLLDEAPRDGFDLMSGYAGVLPVVVISEILGIPHRDWERVKSWGDALASGLDVLGGAPPEVVAPSLHELAAYLTDLFEARRAEPGDQVVDTLLAASARPGEGGEADPERLTDRELMATAVLLLTAGFETTVNLLGNAVLALLANPAEREAVTDDPSLTANAVEEVLRYEPSVQLTARLARVDTEVAGRRVRAGTVLVCMLAGANRDPAVFDDPERFDVRRANARDHLSFAAGVHYCLGASLARLEGEVGLRLLLRNHPDLALDGRVTPGRGLILRGPRRLPLRLGRPAA
jgi:cytochrome P450